MKNAYSNTKQPAKYAPGLTALGLSVLGEPSYLYWPDDTGLPRSHPLLLICAMIFIGVLGTSSLAKASNVPLARDLPLDTRDSAIYTITPQQLNEAADDESTRPLVGLKDRTDLTNQIEQNIVNEQAYELYRNHYRKIIEDVIAHHRGG